MDNVAALWDDHNRRHIEKAHPERAITVDEVTEAMTDPNRLEFPVERSDGVYGAVLGRTAAGRLLYVAYVRRDRGRYPTLVRRDEDSRGDMRSVAKPGTRFGLEAHHYDPFDNVTDEELGAELEELLRREPPSVTISIRMPVELLERTKRAAAQGGVPYQALIKRLVDAGVTRLEHRAKA